MYFDQTLLGGDAVSRVEDWTIHRHRSASSTNDLARQLPVWHAVIADEETHGRSRGDRGWISNPGGLWLSIVLPTPAEQRDWRLLELGAAWTVADTLTVVGTPGIRVRWPNDIMSGCRKLGGIVIERPRPCAAVVGLRLNVFNRPCEVDPSLSQTAMALSEIVQGIPSVDHVARFMLRAFQHFYRRIERKGFAPLIEEINTRWITHRLVQVTLRDRAQTFLAKIQSIDRDGRLWVATLSGNLRIIDAQEVSRLREV